jgi:hypothetical protein
MSNKEEDDIQEIYSAVQGFSSALMGSMDKNPLIVAAVLTSTALSIYKSTLNDQDFNNMVDSIADSRGDIKEWALPSEHTPVTGTVH